MKILNSRYPKATINAGDETHLPQHIWIQLCEWERTGVAVYRYADQNKLDLFIYTKTPPEDEEIVGGKSKIWDDTTVSPALGYIDPQLSLGESYSCYQAASEDPFSQICRSVIGYHAMATIVSPVKIAPGALAKLLNPRHHGDPTRELVRIQACSLASAPWLYFLGYFYKYDATSILMTNDSMDVMHEVVSFGRGVEDFSVFAACVPHLELFFSSDWED